MKQRFRRSQRVDLDLKLALPARQDTPRIAADEHEPPPGQLSSTSSSLSLETQHDSPKEAAPMVLAACPWCLMYVMLSEVASAEVPERTSVDFLHSQEQSKLKKKKQA
ncbi:hypothetical protein ZIOFF_061583 [Zingiber officinale]|uniref:GIR1-like zinc ribbon domain-containing protein n=1 Tax=Zingiber officinale TaxID=94328 RepID=A0A8J5K9Y0_ZINOF|nr:hypothetical protein ZIOFF_061583 [Zingiber officinale]